MENLIAMTVQQSKLTQVERNGSKTIKYIEKMAKKIGMIVYIQLISQLLQK